MYSFETITAITEWYKATCKGRQVSVLLRGQQRLIAVYGARWGTTSSFVLTFNDSK